MLQRRLIVLAAICFVASVLLLNVGGWRARILARLLRVENWPIVVSPPPHFRLRAPQGFKVSVFAKGFNQPRWLAVAPNGDVFLADSAAGQVVVIDDRQRHEGDALHDVFADRLNLPFGRGTHSCRCRHGREEYHGDARF